MLDYAALSALAAVVREGSFERAALALHVTPSAVSQRIRCWKSGWAAPWSCAASPAAPPKPAGACASTWTACACSSRNCRARCRRWRRGPHPRGAAHRRQCRQPGHLVRAGGGRLRGDAPVLVDVAVDDQDHTAEWLRSGAVLAAVTGTARPAAGCNSQAAGRHALHRGRQPGLHGAPLCQRRGAGSLARAPSLVFNTKDELQARWVRRLCHRHVELPRHTLPSPQAFVTAAVAGMGWGLHPQALVAPHLQEGSLVELVPDTPLDVPLYWQHARAASSLLDGLSREVVLAAARSACRRRAAPCARR
jgi:LysR family transcriptional regulator (chromosome initiation inhibitor)